MKQFGYIYRVTNSVNGRTYVGQRVGEFKRSYLGSGTAIKNAVAKYGRDSFQVLPIQSAFSRRDLDVLEQYFIGEELKTGKAYNIALGGGGASGVSPSAETRAKLSASMKGRPCPWAHKIAAAAKGRRMSPEAVEKMAATKRGRPPHPNTREAARIANTGKHPTPETRIKLSAWQIGRKMTPEARERMRIAQTGNKMSAASSEKKRAAMIAHFERKRGIAA